ncbi:MFS transporter [Streptomyces sp. NPDC056161]|uniref:MFS transporter n=1 Tax=Streptomyces sp. NPDC056161 TaxID=3345732 RepID=UPI0035DC2A02
MGFVLGTVGGGVTTSGLNWRWTMLTLVVIGALVLVGATVLLPGTTDAGAVARLDIPGAALASVSLFALVYGISVGPETGWGSASTLGSLSLAVLALGCFLLVERRHPAPLIPPGLLNKPTVKWSELIGFITLGMCGGTTVLLSLYMQDVLGYSALATGTGFLAGGIAALISGTLAARMIGALGKADAMATGLAVQGLGTGGMFLLPADNGLALLVLTSGAMGFGHVLTVVSFVTAMTSGLRDDEQGVASGLSQLPQFLGAIGTEAIERFFTAYAAGDLDGIAQVLSADIEWTIPGGQFQPRATSRPPRLTTLHGSPDGNPMATGRRRTISEAPS